MPSGEESAAAHRSAGVHDERRRAAVRSRQQLLDELLTTDNGNAASLLGTMFPAVARRMLRPPRLANKRTASQQDLAAANTTTTTPAEQCLRRLNHVVRLSVRHGAGGSRNQRISSSGGVDTQLRDAFVSVRWGPPGARSQLTLTMLGAAETAQQKQRRADTALRGGQPMSIEVSRSVAMAVPAAAAPRGTASSLVDIALFISAMFAAGGKRTADDAASLEAALFECSPALLQRCLGVVSLPGNARLYLDIEAAIHSAIVAKTGSGGTDDGDSRDAHGADAY
mgnify:FL=1